MAVTYNNTVFTGTQQGLGVLIGDGTSITYIGSNLPNTNVSVALTGSVNAIGDTVSAVLSNPGTATTAGTPTVDETATYVGYTGTAANAVYYFTVTDPALSAVGITGFAVSSTGAVPAAGSMTTITYANVPCFARGTRILTDRGEIAIEALRCGDLVATIAGGASAAEPAFRPVRFVGRRRVDLTQPFVDASRPIRVRAGALGHGLPHRDLVISGDHSLLVEGRLVPAKFLVNGTSITRETALAEVTYFHVELDSHDVLLAEGAPAESWLDNGNRAAFSNGGVIALRPSDEMPRAWNEGACAPHLIDGPELAALHARLAALGAALPGAEREPIAA